MFVELVCEGVFSYVGVDFRVAHSKRSLLVQQDATVSRALIHFLLITHRGGGVGLLVTPVQTHGGLPSLRPKV